MKAMICMALAAALFGAGLAAHAQPDTDAPSGDPIWNPAESQVQQWVMEGVQAAAGGKSLTGVRGVTRWAWANRGGLRIGDSREIRFAMVLTPQLIATAAGYSAAWDEGTWRRLNENWAGAIAEITGGVVRESTASHLWIALAVMGEEGGEPEVALWCGKWGKSWRIEERGRLGPFIGAKIEAGSPDARWAARYVFSQCLSHDALHPTEDITVMMGQAPYGYTYHGDPPNALAGRVGPQVGLDPSFMRFFVGSARQWSYLDFGTR